MLNAGGGDPSWLRLVMDSMDEGFGLLAPDFTILELNKEAMRIDARAREEVIGLSHWDAYPGTENSQVGKLYKRAMAERIPIALEHRYEWQDGRTSWLETRALPVENGCLAVLFRDVTERRNLIDRLGASERRFKAAVAAIDGVLWTNSADGRMVGEQPGWASLTGQTSDESAGYGWSAAIHPEDAQPTVDAWEAAVAARATFDIEHRVRRHDGQWRLCAARAVPIVDASGALVEWVGIHRDITDTRADALKLHQLAETVEAVFYIHEIEEQRIAYVSQAYEKIWGRSRKELYADPRSMLMSVHPDDRAKIERAMRDQESGSSVPMEYRLRLKDGTERIILDRPFDTLDPVSGMRRVVGLASDITEFRRAQELLARNAETFTNLVVSNPFGIYVIDADFKLVQISQGARAVFAGIDPLIGRDFEDVLRIIWTEPFASDAIAIFRRTLATGEPFVSPSTIEQRADRNEVEAYDWRTERITLPDGRHGVVCYFYDLSERNAYEAKLTQAIADKDLLAREIDHRVKNSLTIVGSLLSMQRSASASDETRAALDEAAARVIAVARIHERLHKSDQLGIVAFGEYLGALCRDLTHSMRRADVEMDCQTDDIDLPAEKAMSLALIANELVTNAYKHGYAAGATKVSVDLTADMDSVTLTVSDNGGGLPRLPTSSSPSLGLKMVKALARQLNAKTTLPAAGSPAKFVVCVGVIGRHSGRDTREEGQREDGEREQQPAEKSDSREAEEDADEDHGDGLREIKV